MKGVGSPCELLERLIDQIGRDGDGEVHHRAELLVDGRVVHLGLLGHLPGGDGAEAVLLEHVDGGVDEDLSNVIFDYVEVFCNRQRRHSMPGYVSPVEFKLSLSEQQTAVGLLGVHFPGEPQASKQHSWYIIAGNTVSRTRNEN